MLVNQDWKRNIRQQRDVDTVGKCENRLHLQTKGQLRHTTPVLLTTHHPSLTQLDHENKAYQHLRVIVLLDATRIVLTLVKK